MTVSFGSNQIPLIDHFMKLLAKYLTQFKLGGGGGGEFDATQDLNPLLLTKNFIYRVTTSFLFLKFTWKQFGVVNYSVVMGTEFWSPGQVIFCPFRF